MANRAVQPSYVYSKLTPHASFRVLRLHRRLPFSKLRASLEVFTLSNVPQYEAISYRWDSRSSRRSLSINGFALQVSERVWDILDNLSSATRTRYVWIDSVCVNQADLDERSKQVALMGDIYKGASRVLACLEGTREGDYFINTVFPQLRSAIVADATGKEVPREKLSDEAVVALMDFLNHSYWTRTWVIQEIALAKSVKILYGRTSLGWEDFTVIFRAFTMQPPRTMPAIYRLFSTNIPVLPPKGFVPIQNIHDLRTVCQDKTNYRISFSRASWAVLGSQATDPRDKIFGTLGLMVDGSAELLKPDYNKSFQEVFCDATRHLFTSEYPYRFLHYAGLQPGKSAGLPSWVPDWTLPSAMAVLAQPGHPVPYRTGASHTEPPRMKSSTVPEVLLSGLQISRVDRIADLLIPRFYHDADQKEERNPALIYLRWVNEAFRLAISDGDDAAREYGQNQSRFEAFWRTICGDRLRYPTAFRPIPSYFVNAWAKWYLDLRAANLNDERTMDEIDAVVDSVMTKFEVSDDMADMRDAFEGAMGQTLYGRKMAITHDRRMALVPQLAQEGDEIWVILGSETPVCLRRAADDTSSGDTDIKKKFQLVGESYLHGIMDGDALKNGIPTEEIVLV